MQRRKFLQTAGAVSAVALLPKAAFAQQLPFNPRAGEKWRSFEITTRVEVVKPVGVTDEAALDALNEKVLLTVRKRGRAIPSHTRVNGRFALRPCFINPRQGLPEADLVVDEVLAAAKEMGAIG